jgi:hypothetical protein
MAAMCLGDTSNARSASRGIGVGRVRAAAQAKKATKVLRKAVKAVVKSSKSSLKKFAKKETKKAKKLIAKSKKALKSAKKQLARAKASGNKKAIRRAQKKVKAIKKKVCPFEPCSLMCPGVRAWVRASAPFLRGCGGSVWCYAKRRRRGRPYSCCCFRCSVVGWAQLPVG